jgi:outer membrane protein TolC
MAADVIEQRDATIATLTADLTAERAECDDAKAACARLLGDFQDAWFIKCKADDAVDRLTADLAAERAEVERLRAAGDALAEVVCSWHEERIPVEFLDPLTAWEEARRER